MRIDHITSKELEGVARTLRYFDQIAEQFGVEFHGHAWGENGRIHFTFNTDAEGKTVHVVYEGDGDE